MHERNSNKITIIARFVAKKGHIRRFNYYIHFIKMLEMLISYSKHAQGVIPCNVEICFTHSRRTSTIVTDIPFTCLKCFERNSPTGYDRESVHITQSVYLHQSIRLKTHRHTVWQINYNVAEKLHK